ncbi:hypothetical protein ILYODFUR_008163 [Ilyodon furcidens]|uniref:Uncharacterized protein n=1 Tax=Ilyodon furcidens TaxID=33524 RepID=A0ABV0TUM4_9TELE
MEAVEIPDEGFVHDESCRNPGPLLRTIALPVHQIRYATSLPSGPDDALDSVDWAISKKPGGALASFGSEILTYLLVLLTSGIRTPGGEDPQTKTKPSKPLDQASCWQSVRIGSPASHVTWTHQSLSLVSHINSEHSRYLPEALVTPVFVLY